jgi:hypothetical protein
MYTGEKPEEIYVLELQQYLHWTVYKAPVSQT